MSDYSTTELLSSGLGLGAATLPVESSEPTAITAEPASLTTRPTPVPLPEYEGTRLDTSA